MILVVGSFGTTDYFHLYSLRADLYHSIITSVCFAFDRSYDGSYNIVFPYSSSS